MKYLIKFEEAAMLALCLCALVFLEVAWWWYVLLALGPDIGMAGYMFGNRVGAFCYNLFHHKGMAIIIVLAGWFFNVFVLQLAGIALFGHSSMDRLFGYGLKYSEGFKFTHLGEIGKKL